MDTVNITSESGATVLWNRWMSPFRLGGGGLKCRWVKGTCGVTWTLVSTGLKVLYQAVVVKPELSHRGQLWIYQSI